MQFYVVISSTTATYGELHNVSSWESTPKLDQAGTFNFEMSASDPKFSIVQEKRIATCYTVVNGAVVEIGAGIIDAINLDVDASGDPTGMLTVSGSDLLRELVNRHVGQLEITTTAAPQDIIALAPTGWTLDTVNGYDTTLKAVDQTFEGETVLEALVKLAELTGEHFRLGAGRKVVWLRKDQPSSGVVALYNVDPVAVEARANRCVITSIRREQDAYDSYIGRVYAIGSGTGDATTTLQGGTVGYAGYAIGNDSKGYYLEHTATWTAYGIDRYLPFKDIADVQTLVEAAYEYLRKALTPNETYSFDLAGLKTTLNVGSTIRAVVHQWVDRLHTVNIDADLLILDVENQIDDQGLRTVSVSASTSDRKPQTEAGTIANSMGQSWNSYTHTQPVSANAVIGAISGSGASGRVAKFTGASAIGNSNLIDSVLNYVLTVSASLTGDKTLTVPDATATMAVLQLAQTFTKAQTINPDSDVVALIVKMAAAATANPVEIKNSGGTNLSYINASGGAYFASNCGVGASVSAAVRLNLYFQPVGAGTGSWYGLQFEVRGGNSGAVYYGINGYLYAEATIGESYAFRGQSILSGSATFTQSRLNSYLGFISVFNTAAATLTKGYIFRAKDIQVSGGATPGTVTTQVAFGADDLTGAGTNKFLEGGKGLSTLGDQLKITGWQDIVQLLVQSHSTQTSDNAQFGNVSGGNYSAFEGDGTLKFVGDAKVWDDLRVEPVARTTGNNAPAFEKYYDDAAGTSRGVYLYSFDDAIAANEKEIFFTMQMPHGWASTAIDIHVHWVGAVDDTTAEPRWGLEYVWQNIGNVYGDTTTIYAATKYPTDANVTANKHYLTEFAAISPGTTANGLSSVLIGRLFRNSSDAADTYDATGAKCGLLYIDAHYEIDTIGSRSELSK